MTRGNVRLPQLLALVLAVAACGGAGGDRAGADAGGAVASCDERAARAIVGRFGERLKDVSLLAPDSIVARGIREAYGELVTPELLERWTADPREAPGREVSSPWPDGIDVRSVEDAAAGTCRVEGEVTYATSAGDVPARTPVTIELRNGDGWRIDAYEADGGGARGGGATDTAASGEGSAARAADVIRRYYDAIAARDYRAAYALWSGAGAASGQSLEEFAAGFAGTARTEVRVGAPGRVEGAAGSRFVEIPVVVDAVTRGGEAQRFEGRYVLRRSVVDGATAEQRAWRIHSAELSPAG